MRQPENRLKILQVLPSLVSGGVERGTLDLANFLSKQGHEAWVISSGGPLVKSLEAMGAKHVTLPVHSKNPFQIWKNSQTLYQIIQQHGFDLIHARSRAPAWSCYWASKKASIPFLTTFHGQYGHQNTLKRFYNSIMLKGDACIAVSSFIASHIETVYPQKHTPVHLIHRGIDLKLFTPSQETKSKVAELKNLWKIHQHNKVIILPGRLTRIKGHRIFLEAISKLKDQDGLQFLIVGDEPGKGHYKQELQSIIDQQNLTSCVQLTGNCEDMSTMYQMADIVISASIKPESFGRTACEAQAMGCLVIATEHGGSLETISPAQRRLMCKSNDSTSMADSIEKALSLCEPIKQQERTEIDVQSRVFIEKYFSLDKMCNATLELYQDLISEHKGQA